MTRITYHVLPRRDGKWQVKKEGAARATRVTEKKSDAVIEGKKLAKNTALGQLVIHKQDGSIQTEYTYGADPRSSKG